jgi:hypothetical protein
MSGIGAIPPADKHVPVEGHQPADGDGRKKPPPRRKPRPDDDLVKAEPHKLDVEA